jgi:hypothetical protein
MKVCKDGFFVDTETGEVDGECFELDESVQDHDLEHYSVMPPVPAMTTNLRTLAKENMKERGIFIKGSIDEVIITVIKVIGYLEKLYNDLDD